MNNATQNNIIEEIELKDLEQRIEFGCCGGDDGGNNGTGCSSRENIECFPQ